MAIFNKEFKYFLNEAKNWEMRVGDYVECGGNFTKITPVKGLIAKIISSRHRPHPVNRWETTKCYTLEFEVNLVDRRSGEPVETNTIEITCHQLKNLKVINGKDYERIRNGFTAKYVASAGFQGLLRYIRFNPIYNYFDASYFDVDDKGNVSMLPANKIEAIPEDQRYTSKQRQQTKITRILQKLNDKLTAQQIADYGNIFNARWKELNVDLLDRIQVVTGNQITYWYQEKNYYKPSGGAYGGTLNGSCMRYDNTQHRVAFYSKYPDKVAMCIFLDENKTKLLGRAIVWRLDTPEGEIFMDRIYYVSQEHEAIMANYANKMGWKTKLSNYHTQNRMFVKIPYRSGDPLPYLDTFKWNGSNGFQN